MTPPGNIEPNNNKRIFNLAIAGLLGQVGCLTLVIVLGAVLAGLWLDNQFQTKPVLTIVLLLISIPVSLVVMFAVARAGVARIHPQTGRSTIEKKEDADIGKYE